MRRITLQRIIGVLELPLSVLDFLYYCTDPDSLAMSLREFKKLASNQRKKLAKKYHPDVCRDGGERMKEINGAMDFVNELRMMPVRRQPIFRYDFRANAATTRDATFTYYWNA